MIVKVRSVIIQLDNLIECTMKEFELMFVARPSVLQGNRGDEMN